VSAFGEGDAVYAMLDAEHGGYAEFVAFDAALCARKPGNLSHVEAASVPLAGLTAWQGLFEHGQLQMGQRVLIHGAGGGVGHFAVQFAKARGATVIATASGEDREFVSACGADQVIDYKRERFEDAAQDIDLVFDLIGGETQRRSFAVLARGGTLIATVSQPDAQLAATRDVRAAIMLSHPDVRQLNEITLLIEAGKVRPHVQRAFPLADARAAQTRVQREHTQGKTVLEVAATP
jgi:NADPH:quinone reductase-like Zn-dependent oxidoreductase